MNFKGKLIAVTGLARSGKSTVQQLVLKLNGRAAAVNFADHLKAVANAMFDWKDDSDKDLPTALGFTKRSVYQELGTFGRQRDPDIWLNHALQTCAELLGHTKVVPKQEAGPGAWGTSSKGSWVVQYSDLVVIADARFHNECRRLKDIGAVIWRTKRTGSGLSGAAGLHESERDIWTPEMTALVDNELDNNGTLEQLEAQVRQLLAPASWAQQRAGDTVPAIV